MIKSIIVVRLSAIGDVVMMLPMVRRLQANLPNATITWVISNPAYELVKEISDIEFIVIDKPKSLRDYLAFYRKMRARNFDVLLAAQASLRANLLYPGIRAKRKIGYDKARARDLHRLFVNESITPGKEHTLEGFLKFASQLGINDNHIKWDFPISQQDLTWAQEVIPQGSGPLVMINPAASKLERCWYSDRYIEVIRALQAKWNARVVLIGGPGHLDVTLGKEITAELPITNLIGQTKLPQLLTLLSQTDVVCCPDTGTAHMGAAVGVPVVALHAVTNPAISAPYNCQKLAVSTYPNSLPWGTQVRDRQVMAKITVESVVEKLDLVLSSRHCDKSASK